MNPLGARMDGRGGAGPTHVLVATLGSAGDLYPFLSLARGLLARGHRVTLLGPQAHAAAVEAAGVPFEGVGTEDDYFEVLRHPDLWHPRKGFGVLWRAIEPELDEVAGRIAGRAPGERLALLAHPFMMPAAALARAARPDLRIVAAWLAPTNLRSVRDPLRIGPRRVPE
ncbi:MAG: glycosyltransferase, partial [Burkholderiaceae bacterium]